MKYQAYAEYKDSGINWIGNIPANWSVSRIKFFSKLNPSKAELKNVPFDTDVTFLPMEAIGEQGELELSRVKKLGELINGYTYIGEGDVCIAKITPCFENGKGALVLGLHNGIAFATTEVIPFRCNYESDSKFLYYLLTSAPFNKQAEGSMYGAGGQKRVADSFVANYKFALPLNLERPQIANFLDHETAKIDTLIEKQQQLIQLLKEKRQAVISHAVTKGLNPDVPMRDSGVEWLGEVPAHWDIMQLRRITYLQQGLQIPQENRFFEEGENRVEYITIKSINSGSDRTHKEFIESPSIRVVCKETDILLSRTGATGEVVTNVSGAFHNNFFKVNYEDNKIIRDYLVYFLKVNEVKNHLIMLAGTTTIPDLNHGAFLGTLICLPDKNEQHLICKYLDRKLKHFDYMTNQAYKLIELMQERRTALISAAVTGKIDVRNWQPPKTNTSEAA